MKPNWLQFILGLLAVVVGAQLSFDLGIPGTSVSIPLTGQTLSVGIVSVLLHRKMGLVIILTYLAMGAAGLPVFADGASGWVHLFGKTAGYLWGFLLVPLLFGKTVLQDYSSSFSKAFIANVLGTIMILIVGGLVLSGYIGVVNAWEYGVLPFLLPGILKSILASVIVLIVSRMKVKF